MNQLINIIENLREINNEHGLSNEQLDVVIENMQTAKVCTPGPVKKSL